MCDKNEYVICFNGRPCRRREEEKKAKEPQGASRSFLDDLKVFWDRELPANFLNGGKLNFKMQQEIIATFAKFLRSKGRSEVVAMHTFLPAFIKKCSLPKYDKNGIPIYEPHYSDPPQREMTLGEYCIETGEYKRCEDLEDENC